MLDTSISAKIAPHLPYLRRFGRALTGSQESGDAYVVATLESFVADPKTFGTDVEPRIWTALSRRPCPLEVRVEPLDRQNIGTSGRDRSG
jgi:hypothetical protein